MATTAAAVRRVLLLLLFVSPYGHGFVGWWNVRQWKQPVCVWTPPFVTTPQPQPFVTTPPQQRRQSQCSSSLSLLQQDTRNGKHGEMVVDRSDNDDDPEKDRKKTTTTRNEVWNVTEFENRDYRSKEWLVHSTQASLMGDEMSDLDRFFPLLSAWSQRVRVGGVHAPLLVMKQLLHRWVAQVEAGNPEAVQRHSVRYFHVVMKACCSSPFLGEKKAPIPSQGGGATTGRRSTTRTTAFPDVALEVLDMMEAHARRRRRHETSETPPPTTTNGTTTGWVKPTRESYQLVITSHLQAAAAGGGESAADCLEQAVALLHRMAEAATEFEDSSLFPTRDLYNQVLYAMASHSAQDGKRVFDALLGLFQEMQTTHRTDLTPNMDTLDHVLKAWSHPSHHCHDDDDDDDDVRNGNATHDKKNLPRALREAQALMDSLPERGLTPTVYTYNLLMTCWLRHAPCAAEAARVLRRLLEEIPSPDYYSWHTCVSAHVRAGQLDQAHALVRCMSHQMPPQTLTYNLLLQAWSFEGNAAQAKALLQQMQDAAAASRETTAKQPTDVMPDSYSYTTVIQAICRNAAAVYQKKKKKKRQHLPTRRTGDTKEDEEDDELSIACPGREAETVLEQMEDWYQRHGGHRPTTSVWNAVLHAWVSSPVADPNEMVERVEALVQQMPPQKECRPNLVTYNTVLKAYSQEGVAHAAKAHALLQWMEQEDAAVGVRPDARSFTSVITAYARSNVKDKAEEARRVLDRFVAWRQGQGQTGGSSIRVWNACLLACARTNVGVEQPRAWDILRATWRDLGEEPNPVTFGLLAKAGAHLLPRGPQRHEWGQFVWDLARNQGRVSPMLLHHLPFLVSRDVFWQEVLVGDDDPQAPAKMMRHVNAERLFQQLPYAWKWQTLRNDNSPK